MVVDSAQVREVVLMAQRQAYGFDFFWGTGTQVGQRAMLDLTPFAVRLAEEMPGIGFAVVCDGRGVHIHSGYYIAYILQEIQEIFLFLVATILPYTLSNSRKVLPFRHFFGGNFRSKVSHTDSAFPPGERPMT